VSGGALLILGLRLAPSLAGTTAFVVSLIWLGVLALLVALTVRVLTAMVGRWLGLLLIGTGIAVPVVLTAVDWSGAAGVRFPCRRNWAWLPTYLLRSSPLRSVVFETGGARIRLCYGQPASRGRKMLGGPHVPYGRLWRTGANEPTTLRASSPIAVAGIPVPTGKASLYTVPGPETWEIVVNRATSQWGIESEYTPAIRAQELGRSVIRSAQSDHPTERLTFTPAPLAGDTVVLVLAWEGTEVRIPVWPLRPGVSRE
jgi:hypothetical protein